MLTSLDYIVLAAYLAGVALFGILAGGRQQSTTDYFLGSRNLPWWAVCFSIVATETSTLTVIGVPAVAYGGTLTFFQLTIGYLLGRLAVAAFFLPRYFAGNLSTAYAFLGERFGDGMRSTASITFMVTRLLADGVRLFATAIPLRVIALSAGLDVSYLTIILAIGLVTIAYTYIGGIKAVVWMDVVQMGVYIGGGLLAVALLLGEVGGTWFGMAEAAGKTKVFDLALDDGLATILTSPYAFITAVLGGAVFSMASHGTDQLIVQRLLACRNLGDSRKALVWSAILVMAQFALFLWLGLLLWAHYDGASLADLGLTRGDEIFPRYIIEGLPPGVSGLILAGIVAAAMSSLSSSLNALASSTMMDLYERLTGRAPDERRALWLARLFTLLWGLVFIVFANLFEDQQNPVVELGLAIASFTYGALLGAFLLGLMNRAARQADAVLAFLAAVAVMSMVFVGVRWSADTGWLFDLTPADGLASVGWPWYPVIGAVVTLVVGSSLGWRHSTR